MDYGKILSRSFQITYKYRVLWLFGILLALIGGETSGGFNFPSGGGNGGSGSGSGTRGDTFPTPQMPTGEVLQTIGIIIALVACIFIALMVLSLVVRFVCRGALIGLVQELETKETAPTVRRGFSIGWSRFWQLLGIALTINVPFTLIVLVLIVLPLIPFIGTLQSLIESGSRLPDAEMLGRVFGGLLAPFAFICCIGLLAWIVQLILHPLYQFFIRECVINQRGVFDSIREGYRVVRANLGSVVMLYLIAIGVGIAFGMVSGVVGVVLIFMLVGIGVAVYAATNSWIPVVIGGGLFLLVIIVALVFITGIYLVFEYTYWTEGYLTIKNQPSVPTIAPLPANPSV